MMSKDEMLDLITKCRKTNDIKPQIRDFMKGKTDQYPQHWNIIQMAHHELYLEKSNQPVMCPVCNVVGLKLSGLKKGYAKNCSYTCRSCNPVTQLVYKATCMEKYGVEYASQSVDFREVVKNTCIAKYGAENAFQNKELQRKQKTTVKEKYGVSNVSKSHIILKKIRDSHEKTGLWTPLEELTELQKYRAEVKSISARSYHDHYYRINPNNLNRSRYEYHLDHIFSVEEGFKNKVSPEIIGHWTNLQMLWHVDNSRKNTKCHISLEELIDMYQKNK
ncbi:hypothetical protein UFOVP29_399 [uncultured Caudovirales phage]|uniref:DUF7487 domain-containing protein n=1 Tax=uncultured Caudovirales phage TaxID=2100421 RepID=A0A6J5KT58_9CAUD|nr:hypothetical protein UFOVP29_399 [uncultured Caudovirales phage]